MHRQYRLRCRPRRHQAALRLLHYQRRRRRHDASARGRISQTLRVNAVCPGTVETPFVEGYLEKFHKHNKEEVRAELRARQPIGRLGQPEEIASMVRYLASSEASFITGSLFTIDGGWTAA